MKELNSTEDIINLCKALSSPIRIQILKLVAEKKRINLNEIASHIGLSNGAITQHMKPLFDADLIEFIYTSGKRGSQKICILKEHRFLIDILTNIDKNCMYELEIPIGNFTRYKVFPTCGIATKNELIGEVDEPRYFDAPEIKNAGILWFTKGFLEYRIPNYLKNNQIIQELQISFEISSEAPGICPNWPSDIHFAINNIELGYWTSPGDFGGDIHGIFTPDWWDPNWNSYGLLKLLTINKQGTFIDGGKISDVNIDMLAIDSLSPIVFRISVPDDAKNIGGLTLFGKGFGNYNQDIKIRTIFCEL
jgi:predicted transcriptional regulator